MVLFPAGLTKSAEKKKNDPPQTLSVLYKTQKTKSETVLCAIGWGERPETSEDLSFSFVLPLEVISLVVFVGYSVTYALHIAHNYNQARWLRFVLGGKTARGLV